MSLIKNNLINGCANITGGGLGDNIKRVIPDGLTANINLNKIKKLFTKDYKPYVIGKIILGKNKMKLNEKINWSKKD